MTLAAYRPATAADRVFIVSAWSSSYKAANAAGMIASEDWSTIMHRQIEKLLALPSVRTLVAFERSDPGFVYGFIVGDPDPQTRMVGTPPSPLTAPAVFYAYVKEPFRRVGIARGMFGALGIDPEATFFYACRTSVVSRVVDKIPRARWEPSVARYPKNQSKETA